MFFRFLPDGLVYVIEKSSDFEADLQKLIKREITKHWRILFDGNGYGAEWKLEAEKRGLKNYRTTPKAIEHYLDQKNVDLFEIIIYNIDIR